MNVLAQVVLQPKSAIAADNVVNTFAFTTATTPATVGELTAIGDAIKGFYNNIPGGHNAPCGFINESISRLANVSYVNMYDLDGHLDGTPHGSPVFVYTFTLGNMVPGATALPKEVSACLTIKASFGADVEFAPGARPRARDRGRIYFGPLTQSVLQTDGTTGRVSMTQTFRESLTLNAAALRDDAATNWCVWSRVNALLKPVITGWVDDAFDIQRRRGERAITKTLVA